MSYEPTDAINLMRSFTRHVMFVRYALSAVERELQRRALVHDASKLLDDEFAGFSRINAAARIDKFGSPGYAEGMKRERPTIDLHFSRNTHHPEYYAELLIDTTEGHASRGTAAMTFLDVIEMVCDWWGARKGYDDTRSWRDSVELNLAQKGKYLSDEQLWLARQVAEFLEADAAT